MRLRQKSSRYLRTVDELADILAQLKEIKNRPITPPPDVAGAEGRVRELISAVLPNGVDAGTGHIFDELIDAISAEWTAAGFRHHGAVLADLDILGAQVEAHLAGHTELAAADRLRVRNTDVALETAMLRLADDDLPTPNPVRGQRNPGE